MSQPPNPPPQRAVALRRVAHKLSSQEAVLRLELELLELTSDRQRASQNIARVADALSSLADEIEALEREPER